MAKKSHHVALKVGLTAATVAAAAGAYFLYGKDGAKNRKKVKSWALKTKAEVLEGLENAKEISEKEYAALVDKAVAKYNDVKNIDPSELKALGHELKKHWRSIAAQVSGKITTKRSHRTK